MRGHSALGNPRLVQLKHEHFMFSECDVRLFPFPVAGFVLEYPTEAPQINVSARTAPSLAPIRRRRALGPISGCHSSSLASILMHKFSPCLHLVTPGELCDHVLSGMLHSLSGFPVQISRGVIGCDLHRLIFFSYCLLKAVF